jgi:predicted RNase H-like HicB family nuclease
MGKNYEQDMIAAMKKQNDLIVQQVFIELIQVVAECETYDEFRKRMYGIALGYVKDLETQGIKVPEKPCEKKSEDKDMLII